MVSTFTSSGVVYTSPNDHTPATLTTEDFTERPATPIRINRGTHFAVGLSRRDQVGAFSAHAISESGNGNPTTTYGTGIPAVISHGNYRGNTAELADTDTTGVFSDISFRQRITYNIVNQGGDVDGVVTVVANPEVRASQPDLDTIAIGGEVFQVPAGSQPQMTGNGLGRTDVITSRLTLTNNAFGDGLGTAIYSALTFTAIAKDEIEDLALTIGIGENNNLGAVITREQLASIGYTTGYSYTYTTGQQVPCIFASLAGNSSYEVIEGYLLEPTHDTVEAFRTNSSPFVLVFPIEDSGGTNIVGLDVVAYNSTGNNCYLRVATIRHA